MYFQELTRSQQLGTLDEYVSKFPRLAFTVPDVLDKRLMFFFIEGLSDSFQGLVRVLEPATLEEAIRRALNLEDSTKNKPMIKNVSMGQPKKPSHEITPQPLKLPLQSPEMSKNELRRRGLCYYCKGPWVDGHRCRGKGKIHYIEVFFDDDAKEGEDKFFFDEEVHVEALGGGHSGSTLTTLSGAPRYHSLYIRGDLYG